MLMIEPSSRLSMNVAPHASNADNRTTRTHRQTPSKCSTPSLGDAIHHPGFCRPIVDLQSSSRAGRGGPNHRLSLSLAASVSANEERAGAKGRLPAPRPSAGRRAGQADLRALRYEALGHNSRRCPLAGRRFDDHELSFNEPMSALSCPRGCDLENGHPAGGRAIIYPAVYRPVSAST